MVNVIDAEHMRRTGQWRVRTISVNIVHIAEKEWRVKMSDYIDRENTSAWLYNMGYLYAAKVIQDTKRFPSAQLEPHWIPCSERLPKQNGVYIVTRTISDGFECRNITDACYFDGSDIWHDDTRVNHGRKHLTDVIAWMPLPESYKAESEE